MQQDLFERLREIEIGQGVARTQQMGLDIVYIMGSSIATALKEQVNIHANADHHSRYVCMFMLYSISLPMYNLQSSVM